MYTGFCWLEVDGTLRCPTPPVGRVAGWPTLWAGFFFHDKLLPSKTSIVIETFASPRTSCNSTSAIPPALSPIPASPDSCGNTRSSQALSPASGNCDRSTGAARKHGAPFPLFELYCPAADSATVWRIALAVFDLNCPITGPFNHPAMATCWILCCRRIVQPLQEYIRLHENCDSSQNSGV